MELETAFYWIAIIFMSLCLLIMVGIAIAIFKIKKRINEIHHNIEQKINMVSNLAHVGTDIFAAAKKAVGK